MRILVALFTYAKITYEHPGDDLIITCNPVAGLSQAASGTNPPEAISLFKESASSFNKRWTKPIVATVLSSATEYRSKYGDVISWWNDVFPLTIHRCHRALLIC